MEESPAPSWKQYLSSVINHVTALLPALLWAGLIFIMSDQPSNPAAPAPFYDYFIKKTAHMVGYAMLWFLLYRGLIQLYPDNKIVLFRYSVLIVFGYALSDELHQFFVPGRTSSLLDVGYDMLGVSIPWLKERDYI